MALRDGGQPILARLRSNLDLVALLVVAALAQTHVRWTLWLALDILFLGSDATYLPRFARYRFVRPRW